MTAHEWTTEVPTESGRYWAYAHPYPVITGVVFLEDGPQIDILGVSDIEYTFHDFTHWMHIDAPEPPK